MTVLGRIQPLRHDESPGIKKDTRLDVRVHAEWVKGLCPLRVQGGALLCDARAD